MVLLNEAVNGIFSRDNNISDKIIIGMIPVGTGNDWTKTFVIPIITNLRWI